MALYVYWFVLALVLFGVEMVTGTFYLLVISIALAAGGTVALLGLGLPAQLVFAAMTGIIGIIILRRWKGGGTSDASSQSLDIGQPVGVLSWRDDGVARVHYRGSEWDAELDVPDAAHEGMFYIKAMRGSVLVLTHSKPV